MTPEGTPRQTKPLVSASRHSLRRALQDRQTRPLVEGSRSALRGRFRHRSAAPAVRGCTARRTGAAEPLPRRYVVMIRPGAAAQVAPATQLARAAARLRPGDGHASLRHLHRSVVPLEASLTRLSFRGGGARCATLTSRCPRECKPCNAAGTKQCGHISLVRIRRSSTGRRLGVRH